MRIKISTQAYNEIATALERHNIKVNETELTLEKGTQLTCPIDFKMVTIRRDIAAIAKDCYQYTDITLPFTEFCEDLMNWVMTDKEYTTSKLSPLANDPRKGWK